MKDNLTSIPNDIPKYRKKSTASPPTKSKHKHVYEPCLLETPEDWWHDKPHERKSNKTRLEFSSYCPVCGKRNYCDRDRWFTRVERFSGSYRYLESVHSEEAERELNPATRTLPVFKADSPFVKFVEIGEE